MNDQNKTHEELMLALQALQLKYHSLENLYQLGLTNGQPVVNQMKSLHQELALQNKEKEKRAAELLIANKELAFQNKEKEKRAAELILALNELHFQNQEKEMKAEALVLANYELAFQYRQKEKRAAELDAFSYSVSHDLWAPLRHIHGYVDLLVNRFYEDLPPKARHYLDNIADSSRQMGFLIDALLNFSRTGRQEMRLFEMDMNNMVQEQHGAGTGSNNNTGPLRTKYRMANYKPAHCVWGPGPYALGMDQPVEQCREIYQYQEKNSDCDKRSR